MSEESIGKTVSYTYDPKNPPALMPEQRQRLDSMRDEDIDCSDIPPQTGLYKWSRPGIVGGAAGKMRGEKQLLLDEQIVEFFEKCGGEASAPMNAVLLEYVEAHRKSA